MAPFSGVAAGAAHGRGTPTAGSFLGAGVKNSCPSPPNEDGLLRLAGAGTSRRLPLCYCTEKSLASEENKNTGEVCPP